MREIHKMSARNMATSYCRGMTTRITRRARSIALAILITFGLGAVFAPDAHAAFVVRCNLSYSSSTASSAVASDAMVAAAKSVAAKVYGTSTSGWTVIQVHTTVFGGYVVLRRIPQAPSGITVFCTVL